MVKLPDMPPQIACLPRDVRGFPVPWFVAWVDGKPMFHAADSAKLSEAVRFRKCWVCGQKLGRFSAFVIGPMCSINRVSAEPPSHLECAEFSVKACPFLSKPKMGRMDEIKGGIVPGFMIKRNPGVACIWITPAFQIERDNGGMLFRLGEPSRTLWYAEGRPATRDEVMASIESGMPILQEAATNGGPEDEHQLKQMASAAVKYLPAA